MEKRALLAIALSLLAWVLWLRWFGPRPAATPMEPVPSAVVTEVAPTPGAAPEEAAPEWVRADSTAGTEPVEIPVETPVYRLVLDNRGGVVATWVLKNYLDDAGDPLEIVSPAAARLGQYPLSLQAEDPALEGVMNSARYEVERGLVDPEQGIGERVTFRFADGKGLVVEKTLEIGPGYLSRFRVRARGPEGPLAVGVRLGPGFGLPGAGEEKNRFFVRGQATLLNGRRITQIRGDQMKEGEVRRHAEGFRWGGLEDTYFAAVLIGVDGPIPGARIESHRFVERGVARNPLSVSFPLEGIEGEFRLFLGPKDLEILRPLGDDLVRLVDFRPRFIAPISRALLAALKFIERGVGNWGWSIILLTVGVKVLFYPLTQRSSVSMRRMQQKTKKIQPRIQAIKERYHRQRKDPAWRQKMNTDIMELYQKEGINPLGGMTGCLPLLLQVPILWGLFSLLSVAIELRQAPFLFWLQDLSRRDPFWITPIVMGLTMFLQQRMSTPAGMDPVQRRMMLMMPLVFTFFFLNFPSGLVLYWLVSNLLGIAQQYLINLQADRVEVAATGARDGKLQGISR